jgi:hypothetical protein
LMGAAWGEGEWSDEKAVGGGSPGLWQGRDGVVSGVTECVKGKETGLFVLVAGIEVTGRMPVPPSARASILRFWH